MIATLLVSRGEYDAFIAQLRKTFAVDPTFYCGNSSSLLGLAYRQKGMYPEAVEAYRRDKELSGGQPSSGLAVIYALAGRTSEAKAELNELERAAGQRYVRPTLVAGVYAHLGELDRAFKWLNSAYEEDDSNLLQLQMSPAWEPFRRDPRFVRLMKRVRLS